jgi:hypothetical protein
MVIKIVYVFFSSLYIHKKKKEKEAISFDRKKNPHFLLIDKLLFPFSLDRSERKKRNNPFFLALALSPIFFIRPINDFLRRSSMLKPIILFFFFSRR